MQYKNLCWPAFCKLQDHAGKDTDFRLQFHKHPVRMSCHSIKTASTPSSSSFVPVSSCQGPLYLGVSSGTHYTLQPSAQLCSLAQKKGLHFLLLFYLFGELNCNNRGPKSGKTNIRHIADCAARAWKNSVSPFSSSE